MPDLPNLPYAALARIELARLEAARERAEAIKVARVHLTPSEEDSRRAKVLKAAGVKCDGAASRRANYQLSLIFANTDRYLAPVCFAIIDELRRLRGDDFGGEQLNQTFGELYASTLAEWLELGGDPTYRDLFDRAAVAAIKKSPRFQNVVAAIALRKDAVGDVKNLGRQGEDVAGADTHYSSNLAHSGSGRLRATVTSPSAVRRMEAYMESNAIGQTDFAGKVGTTDRTIRAFRKTGKVRRDIFDAIATVMGITREALLKPE